MTITKPGTVVDGMDVYGCITVAADNVVIRNTRILCKDWYGVRAFADGRESRNLLIEDVEISCGGNGEFMAVAFSNYTARRLNVHDCGDGLRAADNVTIEDSYIHDLVAGPDVHNDGIQSDGGSNVLIRHNRIEVRFSQTSPILMSTNTAPISDVVVEGNYLAGGGYCLYAGTTGGGPVTNMRVVNNRFSQKFFPKCGYWGPATGAGPDTVWSGNVWDETNVPVEP
ncbi:right-handed parallel beta-helix repeat-containing protein [Frankia sp. CNm7]|uniref:Right-handed parallel beta-helix repeat-containing protein n=1 Tax=Frankia nepalensis TaxID=1836974 RepID=A0A937RCK0_9ACTN|nr:right-handed parallel beta-helix repeat-containing protein [Frankia nepalensis]MBL7501232.1 right-handed parallel beta-helix repeat-containing protein [Frankia nepalensis]MBL7512781.1 right-handed parallel beta-helix repeat-containing protein [Frankia nepalensis]MBL7522000.1 right-handed parallel beta-helix repeat-containing protein [Frankia nepalensis]MBL7626404.1 right-handed parallel beta-helix repeat-containing protein [Frankia nepalensis]